MIICFICISLLTLNFTFTATFIPLPFPTIPSSLEVTSELLELKEELKKGEISFHDAEVALSNLWAMGNNDEREIFSTAHEFPSIKKDCDNTFFGIFEAENEHRDSICRNDKSMGSDDRSIDRNTTVRAEQRLAHVEGMLQMIMNQINDPHFFTQTPQTPLIRSQPTRPSLVTSGTSMISALSTSDNIADISIVKQNEEREKTEMQREIEELRRKLAIAQNPAYIGSLADTASASTGVQRAKKKRKRLKKFWK